MDKILIGLYVPAVQEHFDLFVPGTQKIELIIRLMTEGVADLCKGRFTPSGFEMLSLKDGDILLHPERTLADYGIDDGAQLLLM